jgi:hypothetical protein
MLSVVLDPHYIPSLKSQSNHCWKTENVPLHSDNESVYRKFKNMTEEEEQKQIALEVICRHLRLF